MSGWLERLGLGSVAPHTVRAAAFHAAFVGSVTALKCATNALYLAHRPPEGLAQLYISVAVLMALTTVMLAGPLARYTPATLLRAGAWGFAVLVSAACALFLADLPQVLGPLYVVGELYATTLSILFWSVVSGWFDARSSRRAFGLISAGGMLGALVGGLATRVLAHLVGSVVIAVVSVLVTVAALGLLADAGRTAPERSRNPGMFAGARYLAGRTYPRAVALLAATFSGLGAFVDWVFRLGAADRLTEPQLAALFGDLNAAVGLAAVLYQVFLTHRVLDRGGLFLFLAVVPVLLLFTSGAAALTGAFWLLVVMKALEMAGSYSILQAGMQLLYNPVPAENRPAVRAFIDGLVKKGGMAGAGAFISGLVSVFPRLASPWLVAFPAVACLVLIRLLRGAYLGALEEKLRGSRARVVLTVDVVDRATRDALRHALRSPQPTDVLAALDILKRHRGFRPEDHLADLLTHPDEAVRLAGLDLVPAHPTAAIESTLGAILAADRRRPRAAAARALARVNPERAVEILRPYLHDADPGVSCAVVAALHRLPEARTEAEGRLEELLSRRGQAPTAERRELARLLGELPPSWAVDELPTLLRDAEASVRAIALQSAAHLAEAAVRRGRPDDVMDLVPAVQARLAARQDRAEARQALARLGDAVVPQLRANLDDRSLPLAVRIEIPRLLRLVGTPLAADALLFSNIRDNPSLRWRIASSLFQLHHRHPEIPLDRDRTDDACRRRLAAFEHYRPLCHALAAGDVSAPRGGPAGRAWNMLRHTTFDRLLQNLQMSVRLLGLHRGTERMDRAARRLAEAERRALLGASLEEVQMLRGDALEVMDVALQGDPLHDEVIRVLEPAPPIRGDRNVPWAQVADTVRALRVSTDPLVAVWAQRVLRSGVIRDDESSRPAAALLMPMPPTDPDIPLPQVNDPTDSEEAVPMDEKLLSRILALEKVDLFEGLSVDDLAAMAAVAEERHAEPGEVLYREGEPGETMMVLVSGQVDLIRQQRAFLRLGPGESLGQVSLLDRGPRPTTAVVASGLGAELLSIHCDAFMDLVMDRPELTRGLFTVLARRLRALIDLQGKGKEQG
ncbi:MAG: cyclic nucleotide-binding domain-containing protein [Deltaproteobacteria bacterium]|nr:cyclic nucleotide-binding domain-containing protein [Deltaproteobacteria bacterium]